MNQMDGKDMFCEMMERPKMKIMLDEGAHMPERAHYPDAGMDLFAPERIVVPPHGSAFVDTGVHVEIPYGYAGMIKSKSGLNKRYGIQCEGVVDSGYSGSIGAKIYNHSEKTKIFEKGEKITQLVIVPVLIPELELVEAFVETERGSNGFGSTGV